MIYYFIYPSTYHIIYYYSQVGGVEVGGVEPRIFKCWNKTLIPVPDNLYDNIMIIIILIMIIFMII